jgi:hypothetical protein
MLAVTVLFLSGCASVQIIGKSASLKTLPSTVVIGNITPASEKVIIPPEQIEKGRNILFGTFKKELPEFTVIKGIQNLPQGVEDYLLVKTKIMLYHEAEPKMIVTVIYITNSMSFSETEMTVEKFKEKEDLFKFHAAGSAGCVWGKDAAYKGNLEGMARELARTIKRYANK